MKLSELTGHARDNALATLSEWSTDYEWWDSTYEHFQNEIGPARGFRIDEICFQGFYSQGSGASWNGRVDVPKWADVRIARDPKDAFVPTLRVLQALVANGYVSERVEVTNYGHRNSMRTGDLDPGYSYDIEVLLHEGPYTGAPVQELLSALDWNEIDELLMNDVAELAEEIFDALESEYDYLTSEEACEEAAEANNYEFDEDGELQ